MTHDSEAEPKLSEPQEVRIDALLDLFSAHHHIFGNLVVSMKMMFEESLELRPYLHSTRGRVKDSEHLKNKLRRKLLEDPEHFDIDPTNLFERINDLAGFRVLHLYAAQFEFIDPIIRRLLDENRYELVEGPVARAWDQEYRQFFQDLGVETRDSPRMYTSVHYVVAPNRKTKYTIEIQVRTLAEELWGEVDHQLNYPERSSSLSCREQIKVLARITSSCTRLADSIFRTQKEGN